jgi:hypothetical protein
VHCAPTCTTRGACWRFRCRTARSNASFVIAGLGFFATKEARTGFFIGVEFPLGSLTSSQKDNA